MSTIHFNSTKSCNLGCAFCYDRAVRGPTENLPLETIQELAADAAALGCRRIILSGGEPMLRKDWRDIATIFDAAGMEVSLATNGTLVNVEAAAFLKSLKRVTISISVDGDSAVHDRLRAVTGAHRRTMRGLRALKDAGLAFDVNATLSRSNVSEIAFFTRLARDYDCDVRLSLLHPNGRGESMEGLILEPEEILCLREYCHLMRRRGVKVFINLPPLLQYLDEIIPSRGAACGWATNFCGVLANGDVSICGVASNEPALVAGNIKQQSFREIWTTSPVFQKTRALKLADLGGICARCAFRDFCGGACRLSAYRISHDFLAPYDLCQRFYNQGYVPEQILEPSDHLI